LYLCGEKNNIVIDKEYFAVLNGIKHIVIFCFAILFGLQNGYAQSSVLSEGSWHRVTVFENDVYKIQYEDLVSRGVLKNPVPSSRIALFGGPNGAISETNYSGETFDLQEIAILVEDGGSGTFGAGSFILFYGQSPSRWNWNSSQRKYTHHTNVFTDDMSYFLTTDYLGGGNRKRLQNKPVETSPATQIITNFRDHYLHEKDLVNPFKSSQEWYGEKLDPVTSNRTIELNLQGLITSQSVDIKARFVVNEHGTVVISSNNNPARTLSIRRVRSSWMLDTIAEFSWLFANAMPSLSFAYTKAPSSSSSSWMHLDFLELHYRRRLSLGNTLLQFRFVDFETSEIGEFRVSSANSQSRFWDISNPLEPKIVQGTLSRDTFSFTSSLAGRPEFVGFSENSTALINRFEPIRNQNLHELDSIQYVMVVYPEFRSEAERLAEFHRNRNLNVLMVTPAEVFNEFSYGRQDPMAIRRMMRHYRNKALSEGSSVLPEYLLLFGSPSYDYRNRIKEDSSFVLNYQFPTGLLESQSFSTDDMFGFLADGETGFRGVDRLAIGIGRFPARTLEQAKTLVDKTISYATPKLGNFGDWRNVVTNLSDDGVTENFVETYEDIRCIRFCDQRIREFVPRNSGYFEPAFKANFKEINIEKIYLDAFPQVATPSGARYPAAKTALRERIDRGTLILNYQGHSGEIGMADEDIMNMADIQSFENIDRLMVFFTGSCSFARYDNPSLISAGEWTVLSHKGGAVAHIGASRVAYTNPNDVFHGAFNHFVLTRDNGNARSLGESMMLAKNRFGNEHNLKQFVLLGDPAISTALPKYRVITTHINETPIESGIDTIKALDHASIAGRIVDFDNNFLSDFNGEINIIVFDKPTQTQTLGQKNSTAPDHNPVIPFETQKNALFRGSVAVVNGEFYLKFMVPKNINYSFGFGKISYYAYSDSFDATGAFDSVVVGGFGKNFDSVADAPIVRLFLNDTNFRNGNIATPNPILLAKISDEYGINHSGAGIGHNITLTVNDDSRNQIYLNDFFEYLPGSSTNGEVRYQMMFNFAPGKHNLKLKVSNVFNISTEASLDFEVVVSNKPIIAKAYCYPNPIRDYTNFYFTHNAPKKIKRIEIDIIDVSGRLITRLSKNVTPSGFAIEPIGWDTRDANGNRVRQGIYLYRIRIVCEDGSVAEKTEKLIIGI
jgi:hypothetical protein